MGLGSSLSSSRYSYFELVSTNSNVSCSGHPQDYPLFVQNAAGAKNNNFGALVCGGEYEVSGYETQHEASCYRYAAADDSWQLAGEQLSQARSYAAAASVLGDGSVWVLGGYTGWDNILDSTEIVKEDSAGGGTAGTAQQGNVFYLLLTQ